MMYVAAGLVIWTTISFGFFLSIMGYKFRKEKWYDWPILAPFFVIVWVSTLFGWNK